MMKQEKIVEKGYDKIASKYHEQRDVFDSSPELKGFTKHFKKGAKILDLGCGAGVPVVKFLVEKGFDVTGIDISEGMLKLAKKIYLTLNL